MKIRIMFSGRNYDIADSLPPAIDLPEGSTVDDVLAKLAEFLPEGRALPPSCLLALGGTHIGTIANHAARPFADGEELVILAPVAGG